MHYKSKINQVLAALLLFVLLLSTVASAAIGTASATTKDTNQSTTATEESNNYFDSHKYDGKRIGVQTGSIYVDVIKDYIDNPQCYYYDTIPDAVTALKAGKIDAVISDEMVCSYSASKVEGLSCKTIAPPTDLIAIVAAKTDAGKAMVNEINKFLADMENSGELDEYKYEWLNNTDNAKMTDYTSLPATNGTLNVATSPEYPPMEFIRDNQIVGYEIELVAQFCKEYGYALNLTNVNFGAIIVGISTGMYDLGASTFSVTEERKESVYFTDPIYENSPALIINDKSSSKVNFIDKITSSFKKTFITESRWKMFVDGSVVTLLITVLSIVGGLIIGFIIHLICRRGNKVANAISNFIRWLVRGMPEVVFLMVMFYIVLAKANINGMWTAVITFTILFACSVHEMLNGGEDALDPGQDLAATALGYTPNQAFFKITLPQIMRFFLPSFLIEVTTHMKATAIVGYVTVVDITKVGDLVRGTTYDALFPLIAVAIIYFILSALIRIPVKIIIKKTDPRNRKDIQVLKGLVIK